MDTNWGQNPSGSERLKTALGWIAFLSSALAVSVEVFLHRSRTFGERYVGLQAAAVLLIVPFYSVFWQGHDLRPLMWFLGMFLFMCFLARLGVAMQSRKDGPRRHTRYSGHPRLMRLFPKLDEIRVKGVIELFLVFFAGVFTHPRNEPLGGYLILAALGLFVSVHLSLGYQRERLRDLHDSYVEQSDLAERFRRMRQ